MNSWELFIYKKKRIGRREMSDINPQRKKKEGMSVTIHFSPVEE